MRKKCSVCKKYKDKGDFHKRRVGKDGLQSECKVCKNEIVKKYLKKKYWENPEMERKKAIEK